MELLAQKASHSSSFCLFALKGGSGGNISTQKLCAAVIVKFLPLFLSPGIPDSTSPLAFPCSMLHAGSMLYFFFLIFRFPYTDTYPHQNLDFKRSPSCSLCCTKMILKRPCGPNPFYDEIPAAVAWFHRETSTASESHFSSPIVVFLSSACIHRPSSMRSVFTPSNGGTRQGSGGVTSTRS